jgi:Homeodomain-like domain-containing protein
MQEGQLLMTQADRDRLVTLKKARKKLIKQREAAEELGVSERQVRRLLERLKAQGDKGVLHGLRGKPSTRRIAEEVKRKAMAVLSREEYQGFGPTLASEYLSQRHQVPVSRETVRQWMVQAKLWRAGKRRREAVHVWRLRRQRRGELVQWDTSEHDWLSGAGPKLYLIAMIDDATSQVVARFAESDSTEENMGVLELWLRRHGRPLSFYTDKASLFLTTEKRRREEPGVDQDPKQMPPTQIGRALKELHIAWIGAHSAPAKGRIERFFETAQDRLVKGLRVAGVKTREQANTYFEQEFLPWWERTCMVEPVHPDDAHRPLEPQHDLAAILSHVHSRRVNNDYTIQFERTRYGIERAAVCTGLRGAVVRVEKRRDESIAIRFGERYLRYRICEPATAPPTTPAQAPRPSRGSHAAGKSQWMKDFFEKPAPSLGQAIAISNATS